MSYPSRLQKFWLTSILASLVFSMFSGTEIWPILNYPMFSCYPDRTYLLPGNLDHSGFKLAPKITLNYVDHFSVLETLNSLHKRNETIKRDQLIALILNKINKDTNQMKYSIWEVKINSGTPLTYEAVRIHTTNN
jgi:hypothetical protein